MSVLSFYVDHVKLGECTDFVNIMHGHPNIPGAPIMDNILAETRGMLVWESQLKRILSSYGVPSELIHWASRRVMVGLSDAYEYLRDIPFDGVNFAAPHFPGLVVALTARGLDRVSSQTHSHEEDLTTRRQQAWDKHVLAFTEPIRFSDFSQSANGKAYETDGEHAGQLFAV